MYIKLDEETLHSGERMEIGVVVGPDSDWLPRLTPFLGHKPDPYRDHIRRALEGPLDQLDTRFYVGVVDGRLISQIMVVGDRCVGIVGHVFTLPDERRQGACRAIMARQMDDARKLGYRALGLGTGFETPPYWIYHSFGFRGVAPGNGCMRWFASPEAERELYAPGETHTRDGRWSDWGHVHLLSLRPFQPGEELPRSLTLDIKTQSS
ncbi:MAG: GNAT family N-acetyltransferase, partial [Actinomycetota bacterium]